MRAYYIYIASRVNAICSAGTSSPSQERGGGHILAKPNQAQPGSRHARVNQAGTLPPCHARPHHHQVGDQPGTSLPCTIPARATTNHVPGHQPCARPRPVGGSDETQKHPRGASKKNVKHCKPIFRVEGGGMYIHLIYNKIKYLHMATIFWTAFFLWPSTTYAR